MTHTPLEDLSKERAKAEAGARAPEAPLWAIVPALDLVDMTLRTCEDLLAQSVPTRVLLVDQGSSEASNTAFRDFAERHHPRVLLWSFTPALPSLSAAWNRALNFVWSVGGAHALVVNSDVELHRHTAALLQKARRARQALFVSALGVGAAEFDRERRYDVELDDGWIAYDKGGPDFSCFLITRAGHWKYPFDEGFVPAFGEDCDAHRRYLLGGDGDRIFSIPLPFHHIRGGSRTINQSPEARARFERLAGIGRAHYRAKWGGEPNRERFIHPFSGHAFDGVTLPELQRRCAAGEPILPPPVATVADDMRRAGVQLRAELDQAYIACTEPLPPLTDAQAAADFRELTPDEEVAAVEAAFRAKAAEIQQREAAGPSDPPPAPHVLVLDLDPDPDIPF